MIDISVRLIAAFLRDHPEHGINPLAQALPRNVFGGGAPDPAPPLVTVYNDSDDESIGADLDPDEVPAFMLWGDSSADIEVRGYPTAKEIVIGGGFVTEESASAVVSVRSCGYILRAGRQSLSRYNSQDQSEGYRELNGVKVAKINSVVEQRITAAVGRRKLWGLLEIRATVIDLLP